MRSAGPTDPVDPPGDHLKELAHAQTFLREKNLEAEFIPAVGEPADTIVDLADEHDADLIVVGTREPNIIQRPLGQSVSGSVARQAHCDVMIVHAH